MDHINSCKTLLQSYQKQLKEINHQIDQEDDKSSLQLSNKRKEKKAKLEKGILFCQTSIEKFKKYLPKVQEEKKQQQQQLSYNPNDYNDYIIKQPTKKYGNPIPYINWGDYQENRRQLYRKQELKQEESLNMRKREKERSKERKQKAAKVSKTDSFNWRKKRNNLRK